MGFGVEHHDHSQISVVQIYILYFQPYNINHNYDSSSDIPPTCLLIVYNTLQLQVFRWAAAAMVYRQQKLSRFSLILDMHRNDQKQ